MKPVQFTTSAQPGSQSGGLLGSSEPEHITKDRTCPECGGKMCSEPRPFSSELETVCSECGVTKEVDPTLIQLGGFEFDGHGPAESVIMDDGKGCAPGPERAKQVMSALNQDKKTGPTGKNFQISKCNLLQLWRLSGNETDRIASEILSTTIRRVEKKRGIKIDVARVDLLAGACKAGIKKAERVKRLSRKELEGSIHGVFHKEGLWPP